MCMFYKIWSNDSHPVRELIPPIYVPRRRTRRAANMHALTLEVPRAKTHQFSRTFVPYCTGLWNSLDSSVFADEGVGNFKSRVNRALLQG